MDAGEDGSDGEAWFPGASWRDQNACDAEPVSFDAFGVVSHGRSQQVGRSSVCVCDGTVSRAEVHLVEVSQVHHCITARTHPSFTKHDPLQQSS